MKKITLLLAFLITSIGYAQQEVVEDFEGSPTIAGFEGLGSAAIADDPESGGTRGKTFQLVTSTGGNPWQGAQVDLASGTILELTSDITLKVDVYSTVAFSPMVKIENQVGGTGPAAANTQSHSGSGWETLTFTFNTGSDGTATANGEYSRVVFFPNRKADDTGWGDPKLDATVYFDNITGVKKTVAPPPADPVPTEAAPVPTTTDANAYSIYNDTNNYTTGLNIQYNFGQATDVDLDATAAVNNALKVNTNIDGFGQGEGGPDDISSYDFVNFHYWFSNTKGTPGFKFIMIDNDGVVQEFGYQVGSTGDGDAADLVTEAWTQVSIPMSYFINLGFDTTTLFQWKVDKYNQSGDNGGFLYIDNVVLTKGGALSNDTFTVFESRVYPNPTSNVWNISTPNNVIKSVEVYNLIGKRVLSQQFNRESVSVSSLSLSSGMYLAKITTDSGTKSIKLVKE